MSKNRSWGIRLLRFVWIGGVCLFLTVLTQIGGVIYLLSLWLGKLIKTKMKGKVALLFLSLYLLATTFFIPALAPFFGREKIENTSRIKPSNFAYILLNRNYVTPALNQLLQQTADRLNEANSAIEIRYLDANFPFIDEFPLLPHLSHNDGEKIDIGFVYEDKDGNITNKQKSISGYGVFEAPSSTEFDQINKCLSTGYFQYDLTKYTHFGRMNDDLLFSQAGTQQLIKTLLQHKDLGKIFIEPHLKTRMNLNSDKIRYHGCHAVRHDDHIHVQLSNSRNWAAN